MKKNLRRLSGVAAAALASLVLSSCYYDPNYATTSVGASYSSGYGQGYGYGGSGFSTSVFVSTGDPQWGYDPYCYSYYDYRRRAYYDPYLNGYYPIGYRPPVVYGVPHPYGWRRGGGYIRPPVRVSNVTINNYQNRADRYRGTSYGWAKQVRQQPAGRGRVEDSHPTRNSSNNNYSRPNSGDRREQQTNYNRGNQQSSGAARQDTTARGRQQSGTLPSRYNSPVRVNEGPSQKAQRGQAPPKNAQRQNVQRQSGRQAENRRAEGNKASREEENRRASRFR
ncbi:MAG: hypothetical protein V4640_09910 [Verrucomicrobiota bacterium]